MGSPQYAPKPSHVTSQTSVMLTTPTMSTPTVLPSRTEPADTGAARMRGNVPSRRSSMMERAPLPMMKNKNSIATPGAK